MHLVYTPYANLKSKRMKSLVILNQAISPITVDIANSLLQHGCDVRLYTGSSADACSQLHPSVKQRHYTPYRRTSGLQRIWTWGAFFVMTLVRLLVARRPYEIFAITNPPFNVFTALILKKTRGIRYHLLLFDIYPDAAVQYGYCRSGGTIDRLWSWLTKISCANATNIFTISERMRVTVQQYVATEREIHIIHNWADNSSITPVEKQLNPFLIDLGLAEKRTVLYSGNFGKTHDLTSIVEAAKRMAHRQDIHFLMVGDGEQKKHIEALLNEYQLNNFSLLPYVDSKTFPYSVASGDITIVTLDSHAESISTPSKTYCAMAAGSAIVAVASPRSELSDLIDKHNMGAVVPPGDPALLAQQLQAILDDHEQLSEFKANARRASYDYTPANAELYSKVILELSAPQESYLSIF